MNRIQYILFLSAITFKGRPPVEIEPKIEPAAQAMRFPHPAEPILRQHIQYINGDKPLESYSKYNAQWLLDSYKIYFKIRAVGLEEAKEDFCETYIERATKYNSLLAIWPYLKYFPVTTKDTELEIFYKTEDNTFHTSPNIAYAIYMAIVLFYILQMPFKSYELPIFLSIQG
ncbi:MAG: hypothetical protein QRY74_05630 [Chlamydia sp.]